MHFTNYIRHPSSVIRHPSSVIRHPSSVNLLNRLGTLDQNRYPVMNHFHKATPDFKKHSMAPVFQNLDAPAFQSTHQRSVFVQYFKRTRYARELDAVDLVAEEFTFWSKYFEIQFEKLKD